MTNTATIFEKNSRRWCTFLNFIGFQRNRQRMISSRLWLALCLLSFVLNAQIAGDFIETSDKTPFTITGFSTKQGLPQSQVTEISPRNNGSLFISTANGIVEYNGHEFKTILSDDAYKKNAYSKLIWNEKTKKLFGDSRYAFFQILPTFKIIYTAKATTTTKDSIYYINDTGTIYVGDFNTLNFRKRIVTSIKEATCLFYADGFFLIGTTNGLYRIEQKLNQTQKLKEGTFTDLRLNPYSGRIYALTQNEIYVLENNALTLLLDATRYSGDALLQDIEFVNANLSYVASNFGLIEINKKKSVCYTKKSGLPSQYLFSLYYYKNEDCLFAGTGEKGLLKLKRKNCFSLSSRAGFRPNSSLSSIIKTSTGQVLAAESGNTIFEIKPDTVLNYYDLKKTISSLSEINGVLFAGTWGAGVQLIENRKLIGELLYPVQLPGNSVFSSFQDSRGGIWIGTESGISHGLSLPTIRPLLKNLIKQTTIVFYELKNGNICIGGRDGVYILDKKNQFVKHISRNDGFVGREVRSFYEDQEGKLWIGSYDGGLFCWFKNKLTSINKLKNSYLDNDAFCLAKDTLGYLHITSNHGLWRVKEKDLSDFYYGKKEYLIPFYYGEENGILNTEFNGGFQNNYLKTTDERFYFPTLQGIVLMLPDAPLPRKLQPLIERIYVNDTLFNATPCAIKPGTYSIQFDFSCVNFSNNNNVYYQYKLDGSSSTGWSLLKKEHSVMFKLLPAGNYTFSVRAIDAFNDRFPAAASFAFSIKPTLYKTLWFRITAALTFSLLLLIAVAIRVRRIKRKAAEKEYLKRTMAELELKAIQAQLNPHFIFNCLSTIKYFILDKDFENANKGLNYFSKLLRDVINNSDKPVITVENEITFLTDYLKLEKMKLQDNLEFNIRCNPTDLAIIIPAMLIQPHVENAMKHGIGNLMNKKGELSIDFTRHSDWLEIRILDNGIGRSASSKISKRPNHISRGISLTADKSEVFRKLYNTKINTEITDLYNENKHPVGTLVTIKIPFIHDHSNH